MKSIFDLMHEEPIQEKLKARKRLRKFVIFYLVLFVAPIGWYLLSFMIRSFLFDFKSLKIDYIDYDMKKSPRSIHFKAGFESDSPLEMKIENLNISVYSKYCNDRFLHCDLKLSDILIEKGKPFHIEEKLQIKKLYQKDFFKIMKAKEIEIKMKPTFSIKIFGKWFSMKKKIIESINLGDEKYDPIQNIFINNNGAKITLSSANLQIPKYLRISIPKLLFEAAVEDRNFQFQLSQVDISDGEIKSEIAVFFILIPNQKLCFNDIIQRIINTIEVKTDMLNLYVKNLVEKYEIWNDFFTNFYIEPIILYNTESKPVQNTEEPIIFILRDNNDKNFYVSTDFNDDFGLNFIMTYFTELYIECQIQGKIECIFQIKQYQRSKKIVIIPQTYNFESIIKNIIRKSKFRFNVHVNESKLKEFFGHFFIEFSMENGLSYSFKKHDPQIEAFNHFEFHHLITNNGPDSFTISTETYKTLEPKSIYRIFYFSTIQFTINNDFFDIESKVSFAFATSTSGSYGLCFKSEIVFTITQTISSYKDFYTFRIDGKDTVDLNAILFNNNSQTQPLYYYLIDNTRVDIIEIKQMIRGVIKENRDLKPKTGLYVTNRIFCNDDHILINFFEDSVGKSEMFARIHLYIGKLQINYSSVHKIYIKNLFFDCAFDFFGIDAINTGFIMKFTPSNAFCRFLEIITLSRKFGGDKISNLAKERLSFNVVEKHAEAESILSFEDGISLSFSLKYDSIVSLFHTMENLSGLSIGCPNLQLRIRNAHEKYIIIIHIYETNIKFNSLIDLLPSCGMRTSEIFKFDISIQDEDNQSTQMNDPRDININDLKFYFNVYFASNNEFNFSKLFNFYKSKKYDLSNHDHQTYIKIEINDDPHLVNVYLNHLHLLFTLDRIFSFFKLLSYHQYPRCIIWSNKVRKVNLIGLKNGKTRILNLFADSDFEFNIVIDYDRPHAQEIDKLVLRNCNEFLKIPIKFELSLSNSEEAVKIRKNILQYKYHIECDLFRIFEPTENTFDFKFVPDNLEKNLYYFCIDTKNKNLSFESEKELAIILEWNNNVIAEARLCSHIFNQGKLILPIRIDLKSASHILLINSQGHEIQILNYDFRILYILEDNVYDSFVYTLPTCHSFLFKFLKLFLSNFISSSINDFISQNENDLDDNFPSVEDKFIARKVCFIMTYSTNQPKILIFIGNRVRN